MQMANAKRGRKPGIPDTKECRGMTEEDTHISRGELSDGMNRERRIARLKSPMKIVFSDFASGTMEVMELSRSHDIRTHDT